MIPARLGGSAVEMRISAAGTLSRRSARQLDRVGQREMLDRVGRAFAEYDLEKDETTSNSTVMAAPVSEACVFGPAIPAAPYFGLPALADSPPVG